MLALSTETAPKCAVIARSTAGREQILRALQVTLRNRKRDWQDADRLFKKECFRGAAGEIGTTV
jgi:hypothetical protein